MPTSDAPKIVLPVFAGQGTTRTSRTLAAEQAIRDAFSPAGHLLLSSCLDVFLAELAVLSPAELDQSGLCLSDFPDPHSLLIPGPKYAQNHIASGISLFLAQALRYQSYVHASSRSFSDLLKANADHAVGVLGLSSGIFPACVVAASRSPLSYITTSVQVFRLVFWISLRVTQFTRRLLKERPVDATLPWSVACLGLTKADVSLHIARFEQKHCRIPSLCVTAVLDEKNVTVSGRPDLLVRFSTFVSRHCTVHPTTLDALYHSDLHLAHTRDQILADVVERNIQFPDYNDLCCPLRSTISGDVVERTSDHPSLVSLVVDMVLVHPVNWDLVAKKVASVVPVDVGLLTINMGPGSSALRAFERVVPERVLLCADVTLEARAEATVVPAKQEPIAIVGMAAHTPGAANTAQLWEVLERGMSTVSKIPHDRFEFPPLPPADIGSSHGKTRVETGNFMDDFADFDHKFFKISPREARSMDPQQRVLLHTAYEALENAGYIPDATPCFRRAAFGCYIGAAMQDYVDNLADNIDVHYSTGTLRAFLSGRISYAMQFGGPSVVVDTACSSSIVAIHQACRALMVKDCDAALAGGVNVMTSPNMFVGLERGHFLSPSGQCKAFDASADGYSRGEGCCLFVLKRLSDAIAENDTILGVIRGVEVNQSGLASSITHPHVPTQADLLRTLLANARVPPARVSVVEAHGTGTEAGDSSELASLRSVLAQGRTRNNPLRLTSIKANIGHLEAASGAVGLCKLLLMLRHNMIPAQISLKTLHPLIAPLDVDNTVIDTVPTPWVAASTPRVAVLNNFGAAGSNGALILEEHVKPNHPSKMSSCVFGISARSAGALERLRSRFKQWLGDARHYNVSFEDISYTATARRQIYPYRLAVAAKDRDELVRAIDTVPVSRVERHEAKVIFVFSGQGSQYLDMGASLYATSPVFRGCIDRCQRHLVSLGYPGILSIISSETCDYSLGSDEEFEVYQYAVLAVEFALTTLWKHWGVSPAGVIGQSLGEYAAMVAADVLSIETALSIVAKRARLMSQACAMGSTGMISIPLPSAKVQEILKADASFASATIACVNTESSCVVSGPVEELRSLTAHLARSFGCKTVALKIPLGFHSSTMDPILDDLREHVATLPIHSPSIPIASNVYGTVIPVGDGLTFQADYFVKHCRQPVLFARGVRELEQYVDCSQIDAWIDVSPHAICLPMVKATLSSSGETLCLPSMLKGTRAWDTLTGSLAQLYRSTSVLVDWRRVFDECAACSCVDLPSYPFDSQKFFVPYVRRSVHATTEPTVQHPVLDHPMLSSWSQFPSQQNGNAAIFETPIDCLATYIEGHKVGDHALCPASVYLEQALAGAVVTQRYMEMDFGKSMPILSSVEFSRPLVLSEDASLIVGTHVTVHEDGTGSFSITSRMASSREEHVHVHGDLRFSSVRETASKLSPELPGLARRAEILQREPETQEVFTRHTTYEVVFPRVVEYAEDYQTIRSLTVSGDGAFGVAQISLSGSLDAQPVFIDTMLHVAGFMINMRGDVSDAYICATVGSLKVLRDLVADKQTYTIYCTDDHAVPSRDIVSADMVAVQEHDPPVVVAQLRGAQFRRVRLTSLHRGLALAASPNGNGNRMRTNSNAIVTPLSPLSVIYGRSRSNTHSTTFCGTGFLVDETEVDEHHEGCSEPLSPQTLVSETGGMAGFDKGRIRKIIGEVLGIADDAEIEDESDFGSLGLDSLGSIEAQQALRVAFDRPIPHDIFAKCPTLAALCAFLAEDRKGDGDDSDGKMDSGEGDLPDVALILLQQCPGSSQAPLYLVHDGSGLVSDYGRLLPLHRDVWGISNPRFFCDEPWDRLEDMAEAYALAIERHAGDAGLLLGGWSFGGVVAFEIARILGSRGVDVKGVVLIDSPCPSSSSPLSLSDGFVRHLMRVRVPSTSGPDARRSTCEFDPPPTTRATTVALVMRQFKQSSTLFGAYVPSGGRRAPDVPLAFLYSSAMLSLSGVDDDDDELTVPAWFCDRDDREAVVGPWRDLVGRQDPLPVWDVPGNHFEVFSSVHVAETSAQLERACSYLDDAQRSPREQRTT